MFNDDATTSLVRGGEWSNGAAVQLASGSMVFGNMEIASSGNYTLMVRGSGRMVVNIDKDQHTWEINATMPNVSVLGPVYLDSGTHEVEVSSPSKDPAEFDDLCVLRSIGSLASSKSAREEVSQASVSSLEETDPTKFTVEVYADNPCLLHFSDAYDPSWSASYEGKTVRSARLFGVANGFMIDGSGKKDITVEFSPQRWFLTGLSVSVASTLACVAGIAYFQLKKTRRTNGL
jgi:hypothetical protein